MITKDQLLGVMLTECDICIHLHGKIPDGGLDYRPTPGQRSTLELLQYLSFCGIGSARGMLDGNWDAYTKAEEEAAKLTADDFPPAMEAQKEALRELFAGVTDEELAAREVTLPWGETTTAAHALLLLPSRCMTAYRMQLFLYARQAGNESIGTPNCWAGSDMEI